jgi:subtilisin family serine protease
LLRGRGRQLRFAAAALAGSIVAGLVGTPALAAPATPLPVRGDGVRDEQWHLKTLDVADAWAYSSGAGVTVAVVDSGVDAHHVDLDGRSCRDWISSIRRTTATPTWSATAPRSPP